MSNRIGNVAARKVLVSIVLFALVIPSMALTSPAEVLTNENIVTMLRWKTSPQEIVAVIQQNESRFDFSADGLSKLKSAGVQPEVLDAMWKATLKTTTGSVSVSAAKPVPAATTDCDNIEPHSKDRLIKATRVVRETPATLCEPHNDKCPFDEDPNKPKSHSVSLDWKTGSVSPSCVDHNGKYCFAMQNANNILYTYGFTVNRIEPQGSDLDLLKDAIGKLKDVFGGAAPAAAGKEAEAQGADLAPKECAELEKALEKARKAGEALQDAIKQLDPGKDSIGKVISVPLATTISKWQGVPPKLAAFEAAIAKLISEMKPTCGECLLAQAEALILDVYVPVRVHYLELCSRVNSNHISYYATDLESTNAYNVVVTEYYGGQQTSAETKTFHLDACRQILVASAGFLITKLEARNYLSRTVPDPNDPTKTQNVLGVDGAGRLRPALVALLNYNLPWQPMRNLGFAISAGPVFDISNGKADTSRFGFFAGGSVHLWNRLFLTPGVHVGEFADFPQGFNKPGDVIPTATGTPNPVKRWTARFAFGITFKTSGLSFGTGNSAKEDDKKTAASQPKPDTK